MSKKEKKTRRSYNDLLDNRLRYGLPIALLAISVGFIIYGIFDGEISAVFSKAINLCRECVGIG